MGCRFGKKLFQGDALSADEQLSLGLEQPDKSIHAGKHFAATAAFHATRDQEAVPAELVDRLLSGEHPVKVWREYRGLSQRGLAARAGLNFAYLSQIETGARKGPVQTIRKLAEALSVDLDDLT